MEGRKMGDGGGMEGRWKGDGGEEVLPQRGHLARVGAQLGGVALAAQLELHALLRRLHHLLRLLEQPVEGAVAEQAVRADAAEHLLVLHLRGGGVELRYYISATSRLHLAHISPGEQLTPQRAPFDLREAITARLPSIVRCMPRNLTSNPNINPNPEP